MQSIGQQSILAAQTTPIDWNPRPQAARRQLHSKAENAHSSASIRRESLYPAELSGRKSKA